MGPNDKMFLMISSIKNAEVYLAKGKAGIWFDHLDQMVYSSTTFDTMAGWQFYVVGVANTVFAGTFRLRVWVEKGEAKEIIKEEITKPVKEEPTDP